MRILTIADIVVLVFAGIFLISAFVWFIWAFTVATKQERQDNENGFYSCGVN